MVYVKKNKLRKSMNDRQLKFVDLVISGEDIHKAAIQAGYKSKSNALQVRKNYLYIRELECNRRRDREEAAYLTRDYKLRKLHKVIEVCIPDNAVTKEDISKVGIHAIAEASRIQGHYSATESINTSITIDADIKQLMDIRNSIKTVTYDNPTNLNNDTPVSSDEKKGTDIEVRRAQTPSLSQQNNTYSKDIVCVSEDNEYVLESSALSNDYKIKYSDEELLEMGEETPPGGKIEGEEDKIEGI